MALIKSLIFWKTHSHAKMAPRHPAHRNNLADPASSWSIGRRHVDERPAFRNIDRTCVPGTVWGTASNRTAKSRSTPCLSLRRPAYPNIRRDVRTPSRPPPHQPQPPPSSSRQTQKKPPSLQPRHLCADFHRHRHLAARAATTARHRVVKWIMRTFRDGAEGVSLGSTVGPFHSAANAARGMQGYAPAVIEGRWNALTIFDALLDRLPPAAAATERDRWRNRIDAVTLQLALREWLAGPLNEKPALLVIDGLHDVLEFACEYRLQSASEKRMAPRACGGAQSFRRNAQRPVALAPHEPLRLQSVGKRRG